MDEMETAAEGQDGQDSTMQVEGRAVAGTEAASLLLVGCHSDLLSCNLEVGSRMSKRDG